MIKFNANTKYSEAISTKDIVSWKGNVILEGGTATGKTYFILNVLAPYCKEHGKRILFICNRKALYNEIIKEVDRLQLKEVVKVITYQKIEHAERTEEELELNFDYLVCDEFHHVNEIYNVYTDLSYNWIVEHPAIKIFMSATCLYIFNILVNKNIVPSDQRYYIPKDYSYVDNLYFFSENKAIKEIIEDKLNNTNDKIIYFSSNIERAIEIYKYFKEYSSFYSSKHSKNGAKYITENCIQNESFNSRLLVTTKALDVGINLKDESLKHIISDMFDIDTLIQCLGRKRIINNEDSCNFYIKNHKSKSMKGNKSRLIKMKKPIELLIKDKEKFIETYANNRKFHNDYIFKEKGEYTYNHIAYLRLVTQIHDIDIMQGWKKGNQNKHVKGFKGFLLERLGNTMTNIIDMDEVQTEESKNDLKMYLEAIIGVKLFKEQQTELIHKIDLKVNGKRQRSYSKLNEGLKMLKLNYVIIPKKSNDKRYWIVEKMDL